MKIGIATFSSAENYGAVLQARALQSFLTGRGHAVEVVDYRRPAPAGLRRWLARSPAALVGKWEGNYRTALFDRFRRDFLMQTPESYRSAAELGGLADRFDLLVTGSDQVWNPLWLDEVPGFWDLYFLAFAGARTRRVSYAASFGHSGTATLTPTWREALAARLAGMHAISVREASGVGLVRELCGREDAVHVVDPTLLLDRSHYDRIAGPVPGRRGFLFQFMLHGLEQDAASASAVVAGALGLEIAKCDARRSPIRGYALPSPPGWLARLRDAGFVVTNSFHALVFCLIFHTPFLALLIGGKMGAMNTRIVDLLSATGLAGRILEPAQPVPERLHAEEIDWHAVDRAIAALRGRSVDFLAAQGA